MVKEISILPTYLSGYSLDQMYNMDDTSLFFKLLSCRTYFMETEGKRTVRGIKEIKEKDRITAFLCKNADGSENVGLSIIGKEKNPRFFRVDRSDIVYFSQKNSWADTVVFKRRFFETFSTCFCNDIVPCHFSHDQLRTAQVRCR